MKESEYTNSSTAKVQIFSERSKTEGKPKEDRSGTLNDVKLSANPILSVSDCQRCEAPSVHKL